jgi:hypothetical protein
VTRALHTFAALAVAGVVLAACGPDTTQSVHPQLVKPLDVTDFGEVPVLNERRLDVGVLNVGRGTLTVNGASIREADAPFRILATPDEVGASEEKPVQVAFVPPLEGSYQATLVLETDDRENPVVEVQLIGEGSTRAVMELEPTSLDFDRVAEGTSAVRAFVIRSTGTADLILEQLAFTEGTSDAFSFVGSSTTPATIPHLANNGLPGQIQLTVRFTAVPGGPELAEGGIRLVGTDPDQREVVIPLTARINRAPVALIKPLGVGAPGMEVTLDGSESHDPDGDDPLTYKWTIRSKPLGATTTIEGPEQPVTRMVLDATLPGEYVVELQVTDAAGAKALTVARASIVSAPAQKLLVEMFWNNTVTDIDLHFLRTPHTQVGTLPNDCFFQNKTPDWGVAGDPTDDPEFLRDALTGYGPEVVGYVNPPDNHTFRVVAEYANEHLAQSPRSEVTVRIYLYGVLKFEQKRVLERAGQVWGVADIKWPAGTINPLP